MSRSGYTDDCDDHLALGRWRGAVKSAIRGKRGQKLLLDLRNALYAMPEKRLCKNSFQSASGEFCTLGALGAARGLDMSDLEPEGADFEYYGSLDTDPDLIGERFDIAPALAQEIMFWNDEGVYFDETPEHRWERMMRWIDSQIIKESN